MNRPCRGTKKPGPLLLTAVAALLTLTLWAPVQAKMSVIDSPHNLSASGGRGRTSGLPGVSFSDEGQICVFCHVPHNGLSGTPLWSRALSTETYQAYDRSSTLNASPKPSNKPTGASRLCLSCHDGTLALSKYSRSRISNLNVKMPYDQVAGATAALNATVNANLTTDLSDDHPISFMYTDALAQKSHLVPPLELPGQIRLDSSNNLECTACHDPHDNQYGNFLVMNNGSDNPASPNYMTGSPLCVACHTPEGFKESTHNNIRVPSLGHQCLSCHTVHSAPGAVRLLQNANMEDNCLASCHNDTSVSATSKNMKPLFGQGMYHHPVESHSSNSLLDHDEKETLPLAADSMHVQCVDCHNPHEVNAVNAPLANPPRIDGRLNGVRVDAAGNYAATEFDICFKCHSGPGSAKAIGSTDVANRVVADSDEKERFNPLNPSFHPVMANRRSSGDSLLADVKTTMVRIYCTDCHNSDQSAKALGSGSGPNGPHGSQFPHIMIARYYMPPSTTILSDRLPYSSGLYALCFRCHSEDYIMNGGSAFKTGSANHHASHVRDQRIPCFACHDPHGVPQRNPLVTAANSAHLVNFDKSYAASTQLLNPSYQTTSPGTGSCIVACHSATTDSSYGSVGRLLKMRAVRKRR